ncbi:MAG: hypothetical protein WC273_07080 [Dehalococcoidia bacterium]
MLLRTGVLLLLALALAACGSKKAETPAAAKPAASETAAAATARSTTAPAAGPSLAAGFCSGWTGVAAQAGKAGAPPAGPSAPSPADLKASMEASTAAMKTIADQAPAEIRADFQLYAKAWSDYVAVMSKANYDFMKIATDAELQKGMQAMADPKVQQAVQNIQTWAQKNCTAGR